MLTKEDIEKAMKKATIGHRGKWEVVRMQKNPDEYRDRLYNDLLTGEYVSNIHYKEMENQCGYIFRGSTNQLKYIEYEYQQSDCA